jgi:glycolate oxidase iron-sulfur subunit
VLAALLMPLARRCSDPRLSSPFHANQPGPEFKGTRDGEAAEAILRKCVHCGFCTATCPTYQLLGDELDGPRGRIYLMKQVLEGAPVTRSTQQHLDRCLTCRNCETTCPSGVQYGHLVDIGRKIVEQRVERPAGEKAVRWLLKEGPDLAAVRPGHEAGPAGAPAAAGGAEGQGAGGRRRARANGPRAAPAQGADAAGLRAAGDDAQHQQRHRARAGRRRHPDPGGRRRRLLRRHPHPPERREGGLADMRRNIDAWWPLVDGLTSGQGRSHRDERLGLRRDRQGLRPRAGARPGYADKARRVSALTRDLSELLPDLVAALKPSCAARGTTRLAFHPPCTLQHGQQLRGGVETHLGALGFDVSLAGSRKPPVLRQAGTYSVLQPEAGHEAARPQAGATWRRCRRRPSSAANIGCIQHLQSGTTTPVRHWVEVLDEALA